MPSTTDKLPLLYIPDNAEEPIREVELRSGPHFGIDMREYLGCPIEEAETIYSEDLLTRFRGQENGIPVDKPFDVYHAYLDEKADATRPANARADTLLYRHGVHGPVLVSRTTCVNTASGKTAPVEFHRVTEQGLKALDFKNAVESFNKEKEMCK
ncbi:hypothetical protein BDN70DRAFT_931706 [Pholiota conissans]|uniref:Uncharacterized protein n=1 Tax=Pholiota conissans TaxID=109636 RepID=A0A9P5Z2V5_9AGAR|nr:hypothetical protein BDN70DRAFT_931706 [Pholiota conissans]